MRRSLLGQIVTAGPCPTCAARPVRSSRHPCDDVPRRRPGQRARARSRSRSRAASTTGSGCGSRVAARRRRAAVPAGDLYVVGPRDAASGASNAAATISGTGSRSRSCRPRSARTSSSRRSTVAQPARRAVGDAARRAAPPARARRAVAAQRPARRSRRRGRRARCRRNLTPEEAELLAQFARAAGRGGHAAARRAVLAHPVRLPVVTQRPVPRGMAARRTRSRTCSSTRSTTRVRDRRRRRSSSAAGAAARAGRAS